MTARKRLLAGLGTLVGLGVVVTFGLTSWCNGALTPERHADGAGSLASLDASGGSAMAVARVPNVSSWTYGMRLCVGLASDKPVLDTVGPDRSLGSGYRFLGAGIRQFVPKYPGHTPIISVFDYPPPMSIIPDRLYDIKGYAVKTACALDPQAPYTELLVGLGVTSKSGGGWKGVDVGYTVGGRHRILVINIGILICGTDVAAYCSGPPSPRPSQ